jgi:hypothetical protein
VASKKKQMPRGLLDPESQAIEEAAAAAPRVPAALSALGRGFYEANIEPLLSPVQTAKGLLSAGREFVRDPRGATRAMVQAEGERLRQAGDRPESAFEYYGSMLSPFSAVGRSKTMMARPSRAEQEAAGLYHPISETVLKKPVSEIKFVREENLERPLSEKKYISPESMQGGYAIPFVGDRAIASQILRQVEDNPLSSPVILEGGPNYMRANVEESPGKSGIWASGPDVVSRITGVAKSGMEKGAPVYGVYSAMSPTALGFNTMLTEALLNQIDVKNLSKKAIEELNSDIRNQKGGVGKNFVGIESPLVREQLLSNSPGTGNLRTLFTEKMASRKNQNLGYPDVAATRVAITEPELLNAPIGSSGFAIGKFSENLETTPQPRFPHATYASQILGDYVGGTQKPIPSQIMFPDFYAARRAAGIDPAGDWRSFSLSNISQPLNQQWLDSVMRYLEDSK